MSLLVRCEHPYWEYNNRYHYRRCKSCGLVQFDYEGPHKWRDRMTLEKFLDDWIGGMGDNDEFHNWAVVEVSLPFERVCQEAWDYFYRVTFTRGRLEGVKTDWNHNANGLDADMRKQGLLPDREYYAMLREKGVT